MAGFFEKVGEILSGGVGKGITDIISKKVGDKDLALQLDHDMQALLATNAAEIQKLQIVAEQEADKNQQATIQAELAQNDLYTKQTRPLVVRLSWYGSITYVAASVISKLVVQIPDFDVEWAILTVLMSPVLAYFGVRSLDKWGKPGK